MFVFYTQNLNFAGRESTIRLMADFTPGLYETRLSILDITQFPAGSKYGTTGRVVSNDGNKVEVCYEWSDENCANCVVVECPFNPKKSVEG